MTEPSVFEKAVPDAKSDRSIRGGSQVPGALEWTIGGVSAAVVAAMIGFLLYEALGTSSPAPELHVMAKSVELRGGVYYVEFRALNRGEATAAGVTIEGELMDGGRTVESASAQIDYLPAQSEREGGLIFRNDPRSHRLQLEVKGYSSP